MTWKGEIMNYEEMSLVELRAAAKKMGLKGTTAMRKSELLALLMSKREKGQEEKIVPEQKAVSKQTIVSEQNITVDRNIVEPRTMIERKAMPEQKAVSEQKSISEEKPIVKKASGSQREGEGRTYYKEKDNNLKVNINRDSGRENNNYNREGNIGRENNSANRENVIGREGSNINRENTIVRENSNGNRENFFTRDSSTGNRENIVGREGNNRESRENSFRESNDRQPRQFQNGNTQRRMQDTSKRPNFSMENREGLVNAGRTEDGTVIQVKSQEELAQLDSGIVASGVLEVMTDGFGFIRSNNYMPGDNDVYVSPAQIRKLNLKTGDIVVGNLRVRNQNEKFAALLYVKSINGMNPDDATRRPNFEELTPIFPDERLHMATDTRNVSMRIVDMMSPVGKGQRGMIVAPPKAGKTTLLKEIAKSITKNHRDVYLIILLIDERPEEVTDIKESIEGPNVEVVYSTFDELPEHHKRVSEMVLERAKRLVEYKQDVVILLDSITRLARAYNLVVPPSGRTLSGGLDPAALHMPKRFFGAARNMREGGSLTVLATALIETGSKMDDVIYEEFKGTGNMELTLNRKLQEKRIFPAIDILKSSTRRDDLLLTAQEQEAMEVIRKATSGMRADEAVEQIIDMFARTRDNMEFVQQVKRMRL